MGREIRQALERTISVRDLIGELESCDPDARVLLVADYGDYHHTQQALPVLDVVECPSDILYESAYSHSGVAVCTEEEAEEDELVVLLKT